MSLRGSHILAMTLITLFVGCSPRVIRTLEQPPTPGGLDAWVAMGGTQWEWFAGDGQAEMKGDVFSGSAQYSLRMQRDSAAWMAVRYLGIELARVMANRDSIVIINRWDREFSVMTWQELEEMTGFPASLSTMQALFVGNLPVVPEHHDWVARENGIASLMGNYGNLQIQSLVDETGPSITHLRLWDTNQGTEAIGRQDQWKKIEQTLIPMKRTWEMKPVDASPVFLQLLFQNATLKGPLQFPFEIPARYSRAQ